MSEGGEQTELEGTDHEPTKKPYGSAEAPKDVELRFPISRLASEEPSVGLAPKDSQDWSSWTHLASGEEVSPDDAAGLTPVPKSAFNDNTTKLGKGSGAHVSSTEDFPDDWEPTWKQKGGTRGCKEARGVSSLLTSLHATSPSAERLTTTIWGLQEGQI